MATYIDVAALVGIKIHSSTVLDGVGETVTVPSGGYALVTAVSSSATSAVTINDSMQIVGAGGVITKNGANTYEINGYEKSANGVKVNVVIFINNQ